MTKTEAKAGAAMLRAVLAILLPMATDPASAAGAELRRLVGALSADAETKVAATDFGDDLLACFAAARAAGATFVAMSRVERFAATAEPTGNPAVAVLVASLRFSAIQRARILAATTFRSRTEVEECQAVVNGSFDAVAEYAADAGDQETYRALTALHAATTRDLQQRSRPLPRMVSYSLGASMPSLALANRLYGDADRADELQNENRVPHPLFMPREGRALSA